MKTLGIFLLVLTAFALLWAVNDCFYVVDEPQQVVLTQFGRPVGTAIETPGLHAKLPFVQKANYFEKRFLEWDGVPTQIPTSDKKFIWVNSVVRWRIHDPLLFLQRVRNEDGAQSRLDDILDGETRNAIAKHPLIEIVRSTNREFVKSDDLTEGEEVEIFQKIASGRDFIVKEILTASRPRLHELGIEVLDVRMKRINYVEEVRQKVYERMISERRRIAEKYRSEGQGESARILGQKDKELKTITSEAYRTSQEIVGQADAEATHIYAAAYGKDAEFYNFMRTLETYRTTVDKSTLLLLTTDSDFYKFLKNPGK